MILAVALSVVLLLIAWLWLRFAKREVSQAIWSTLEIPELAEDESPLVSIIVCACNQPQDITRCIPSLLRQDYACFEVIVVDSHLSDGACQSLSEMEAAADGRLRLLEADVPPPGWSRRPAALQQGMEKARGDWLLFTTAESYHAPALLSRAMAYIRLQGLGMLSLAPRQECRTFWEHVCHPVAWQYLSFLMPMERVGETNARGVWASEEFLLVSRVAYTLAGGHAAAASALHEGSSLMQRVKALGYHVEFVKAMDLLHARSYRTWHQLWEGWGRSFSSLLGPHPLRVALHVLGLFAWTVLPFAALLPAFSFGFWGLDVIHGWWDVVLAACAILAGVTILQAASVVRRVHRQSHFYTVTLPLGGICVAAAGLNGLIRTRLRKGGGRESRCFANTVQSDNC